MRVVDTDDDEPASAPAVVVGTRWEVVGPFPSGTREHPLLASPLHAYTPDADLDFARRPYGEADRWDSELADGGQVGWRRFQAEEGWVSVAYNDIRWAQLRADHGWAALQHQVVMRTSLAVPSLGAALTPVRLEVIHGTEYAVVSPSTTDATHVHWHAADTYGFALTPSGAGPAARGARPAVSNFGRTHFLAPGTHTLLVRAAFEVRLFGDPGAAPPAIKLAVRAARECALEVGAGAFGPDVVDGWAAGDWLSVPVRSVAGAVVTVMPGGADDAIEVLPAGPVVLVPGQVRAFAVRINQRRALKPSEAIAVTLRIAADGTTCEVVHRHTPRHVSLSSGAPFQMTFARSPPPPLTPAPRAPAAVARATAVPPTPGCAAAAAAHPVILALHGAGVDPAGPAWTGAMPAGPRWAVLPFGGNEWGEDWHGASMAEAWAARETVELVAAKLGAPCGRDTVVLGHSNGGQGAWHLAARYPDRVVGVIAASGYIKIQDYVPYTELTSGHYADPALMGVLACALTPYDNDLHASNLAHIPVLAVHGGDDDNVPPRHSRAQAALARAWAGRDRAAARADVAYVEVARAGHWWDAVFADAGAAAWLARLPPRRTADDVRKRGFTLTCANPDEAGGKAGIRIAELDTPGRLARLDVNARQWRGGSSGGLDLHGSNIRRIEIAAGGAVASYALTNGTLVPAPRARARAYGPLIRILATAAPMVLVVDAANAQQARIAALIAHDLYVYHRTDAEIVGAREALERAARASLGPGNVVVLGRPEDNVFAQWIIAQRRIPVAFPTRGVFTVADKLVYEPGTGIITLHPHPTSDTGLALLVAGNDADGLESASRLFPLRTGVPVPDWAVVSARCKWQAAGGLVGAGFWAADWGWSEHAWMDR